VDFRVIYIDDASPARLSDRVEEYAAEYGVREKIALVRNEENQGALANIFRAVWMCDPEEIVVNLDGDDWFAHRDVLAQLNQVYSDPSVWLTYGQFVYYPTYQPGIGQEIPNEVIQNNAFRAYAKGTTALRTFYAGLFHQIDREDLLYNGDFFQAAYDMAIMLPMLEMAGRHIRFVPEVSYVYFFDSPINDHRLFFEEQAEADRFLRSKPKYRPIPHYNPEGPRKKIYVTPGLWGQLFAVDNPIFNRDGCLDVMVRLREAAAANGYELLQADALDRLDDFETLVVYDVFPEQLPILSQYPKEKLVLFLWEPPSVLPENFHREHHRYFSKIFTWRDDWVDGQIYFKFHYPVYRPSIEESVPFHLKRLCTLIACNKSSNFPGELYTERLKTIDFFERLREAEFDFFGKGWPHFYENYQGSVDRKSDVLKFYKFAIAYENVKGIPGYVTEKIFDCFQAGTVPVYWGAPNVSEYIPKTCFIAREDFPDEASLYRFLRGIDESSYEKYMAEIRKYLSSDAARAYSVEHFIELFIKHIAPPRKS
jgi:glycosyltransferase involved in cell wall biosynthesis